MATKAKQLGKMAVLALSLWCGNVTAQTKTEKESIPVSTGNPSISAQAKKNGSSLEVWVYNNSTIPYKVSFTANITLRGDKGEFTKTISYSGEIAPNKSDYTMPVYISYANATTTDVYNSLTDGKVSNFNAIPVEKENTSILSSSSGNTSYRGNNNNNSPSSSTHATTEPAVLYNTNPQVKEAVERQNRLNELQKKQQENERTAKEFTERNQQNYIEQQKQQQKTTQDVLALGESIRGYFAEKEAREDAEEARKQAYKLRMEEEARSRKVAIEAKINNRKSTIAEFPAKDIPLGSQEKAVSIYYFVYAYDNTINNENGATVYVSNVFEIGKYNDGTRAYTATVKNEITNLTPFTEVLHGYYYTQQQAEQLRQTFLSILQNNGVAINEVNYKGKPATVKNAGSESTTQKSNQSKYGKTISVDGSNLAPAKLNDSKPREVPKQNLEKAKEKESKYGKTIKID